MIRINTTCPVCGAPHARRLSQIYEEGLSTSDGKFESVGTLNTIGRQKLHTQGTSAGVQQTQASKAAAPPPIPPFMSEGRKEQISIGLSGMAITVMAAILIFRWVDGFIPMFLATSATAVGGMLICQFRVRQISVEPTKRELEEHRRQYPKAYASYDRWKSTFKCLGCGEQFIPMETV